MAARKTKEQFVSEMNAIFPNLVLIGLYTNVNVKTRFKCLIHDFEFDAYPCNILAKHGCKKCGAEKNAKARRKSHEKFVLEMSVINKDIDVVGQYVDTKTKVLVRCKIDGYEWYADPRKLLKGSKCSVCENRVVMMGVNDIATTHKNFVKYFKNKDDANKYVAGSESYIDAICPECGYEKKIKICNLIRFGFACNECYKQKYGRYRVSKGYWTKDTMQEYLDENYPGYKMLDFYREKSDNGVVLKVFLQCPNKNHPPYWAYWTNITSGYTCLLCYTEDSMSKGERAAESILKKYKYSYEPQKRFEDCRDKNTLPFDFYLQKYNLVIEIMGIQHERPVEYFGGQKAFETCVYHDKIKRNYLKSNNIHCLDIWYYEFDKMEELILHKINSILNNTKLIQNNKNEHLNG